MHCITFLLLVIGGLNWLLLALFGWEIGMLFGGMDAVVSKVIYILIGLAAIAEIFGHKKFCRCCGGGSCERCEMKGGDMNSGGGHQS